MARRSTDPFDLVLNVLAGIAMTVFGLLMWAVVFLAMLIVI